MITRTALAAALLLFIAVLPASTNPRPHFGERRMGIYIVNLSGNAHDPMLDAIIADLLKDGCWARKCTNDEESLSYGLRSDLPANISVAQVRAAVNGDGAMKLIMQRAASDYSNTDGYFWSPDGFLIFDRTANGKTVQLVGIGIGKQLKRGAPARAVVTIPTTGNAAARAKALKAALKPIWGQFVP